MSELERLLQNYQGYLTTPWRENLAGPERVWFLVYSPANERRVRHRLQDFETETRAAGHGWTHVDITDLFAAWMNTDERLRDGYFKRPNGLPSNRFEAFVAETICRGLDAAGPTEVVCVVGIASLFGVGSISEVLKLCEPRIKGRLVIFFPGTFEGSNYRLLDSSSGWNYLAVPITAQASMLTP
jgi:hypothetical protein